MLLVALSVAATVTAAVPGPLRLPGPHSPRNASYRISARLEPDDPKVKRLRGEETITWRNTTSAPATELVLHLYMNAFKNETSAFMRESRGRHRRSKMPAGQWGSIDVTSLRVRGEDGLARARLDDTLLTVPLENPVAPGESIAIEVSWLARLPGIFARTGHHDDFYALTQWFPKIGVYDCTGADGACRWRAHQHHLNSEFFADYGVYDVELELPRRFVVASTGVTTRDRLEGDTRRLTLRAEDVHDFAIIAYPRLVVFERTVTDLGPPLLIRYYCVRGHEANASRHLDATEAGLRELERRLGPYPYSMVSVVDVPRGAEGAGGMEYPTLFLTFDAAVPRAVRLPENVTLHELSHQYFYGLVGSDEVEDAWLDEGLTTAMTGWALRRMFGEAGSVYDLFGHRLGTTELDRLQHLARPRLDPVVTRSFEFATPGSYAVASYARTSLALATLEGQLGPDVLERGLRAYVDRWRFGHPREEDLLAAFDSGAGVDIRPLWNPLMHGTGTLDYSVAEVRVRENLAPLGLFDGDGDGGVREVDEERARAAPPAPERWHAEILLAREGGPALPVDVLVRFDDGTERRERWVPAPGDPAWRRLVLDTPSKVAWARIDPDRRIAIDLRRWNDDRRADRDGGPRRRLLTRLRAVASIALAWVGL